MESLIKKGLKRGSELSFPDVSDDSFGSFCKDAEKGDSDAQKKLVRFQMQYLKSVYKPLDSSGGLLVSVRKPERDFSKPENNYAVNIEEFFDATSDDVRVQKKNFEVKTREGFSFPVSFVKYKPAEDAIEVKTGGESQWIPLADLAEKDCCFVKNALMDEQFESSSEFDISTEDIRMSDVAEEDRDQVAHVHYLTGEKVKGSYSSASMDAVVRKVVLENKGAFPIENLMIEYQSFVEQSVMRLPKDLPTDYRCVGCLQVGVIAPGEKKEIILDLPATVEAKPETIHTGDYEYYSEIPSDQNPKSEGRMNGIWLKVHRFTPYGERLTREYKSSGVPSSKWESVVPLGVKI